MGLEVHEDSSVCLFDVELSFDASVLFDPYFYVQDWEETFGVWNFQFELDSRMFAVQIFERFLAIFQAADCRAHIVDVLNIDNGFGLQFLVDVEPLESVQSKY